MTNARCQSGLWGFVKFQGKFLNLFHIQVLKDRVGNGKRGLDGCLWRELCCEPSLLPCCSTKSGGKSSSGILLWDSCSWGWGGAECSPVNWCLTFEGKNVKDRNVDYPADPRWEQRMCLCVFSIRCDHWEKRQAWGSLRPEAREAWCAAVHGVEKSHDWVTELNWGSEQCWYKVPRN